MCVYNCSESSDGGDQDDRDLGLEESSSSLARYIVVTLTQGVL